MKLEKLQAFLTSIGPLAIAFSGGLDSRFLSFVAKKAEVPFFVIHAKGLHISSRESQDAESWAKQQGIDFISLEVNPLQWPQVTTSGNKRCYYCKRNLFQNIQQLLANEEDKKGQRYILCDGTNADDYKKFRPGLVALSECGIRSPLAENNYSKQDIRSIGALIGFNNPHQPARPCLLTRFPYDIVPTEKQLQVLGAVEDCVLDILQEFANGAVAPVDFRLRYADGTNKLAGTCSGSQDTYESQPATEHPTWFKAEMFCSQDLPPHIQENIVGVAKQKGIFIVSFHVTSEVSGYYDRNLQPGAVGLNSLVLEK